MNEILTEEKHLVPHPLCKHLTFSEYCAMIPKFYFKKDVPIDVAKNFEVIEKLMVFSYYEYRFVDEGYSKALLTLEMAMNLRYKDFYPESKDLTFNTLIHELTKLNLFDLDIEGLKHLKWTRNQFAHPTHHSFAGIIFWNRIEFIARTINEMYEDVPLRLLRNSLTDSFIKWQKGVNLSESLLLKLGDKETILFRLRLLFINNKETPPTYTFLYVPLFEVVKDDKDGTPVPLIFGLQLVNISMKEYSLTAVEYSSNKPVEILSIYNCNDHLSVFQKWKENFDSVKSKFSYESGIDFHTPRIVIPEIQRFQEM